MIYLALTGLRQGELLALRWSDIDLEAKKLTVARTVNTRKGEPIFTEPKTRRSRRTILIPGRGAELLLEHRALQDEARATAGPAWFDLDLVFAAPTGLVLNGTQPRRHLKRIVKAAGLPPLRSHDLRHACATFLLAQGVDLKVVSELLGHTNIATTANRYAHVHVLPTLRESAARKMADLLEEAEEAESGMRGGQIGGQAGEEG